MYCRLPALELAFLGENERLSQDKPGIPEVESRPPSDHLSLCALTSWLLRANASRRNILIEKKPLSACPSVTCGLCLQTLVRKMKDAIQSMRQLRLP